MTAKSRTTASLTVPMPAELHAALRAVAEWRGLTVTEAAVEAVGLYVGGGCEAVVAGHQRITAMDDSLRVLADFVASAMSEAAAP